MERKITITEAPPKSRGFAELATKQIFPTWYCVKTLLTNEGEMKSEIVRDEKTDIPIAIRSEKKPLDGVFETLAGTTYYTYHDSYAAAAQQVAMA